MEDFLNLSFSLRILMPSLYDTMSTRTVVLYLIFGILSFSKRVEKGWYLKYLLAPFMTNLAKLIWNSFIISS